MNCKWCGEPVDEAEGVCPNCGRSLDEEQDVETFRLDLQDIVDTPEEEEPEIKLPFELKTEPLPDAPVEEEVDELEELGVWTLVRQRLSNPVLPKVACGVLFAALLFVCFLLIRANSQVQSLQNRLDKLEERTIHTETLAPDTTEATKPTTTEAITTEPVTTEEPTTEPTETVVVTEDPEEVLARERDALHEQLQKHTTQLTLTYANNAWTLQADPESLQTDLAAAWDQIPLARMDGYQFGRLFLRSSVLSGTENEELIQLWMGYRTISGVITLNTELDVKNDAGFGERANNGSEYLWQVRADSTEDWVSLRATGGGRMAELHPRVSDPELRLVCKRKNVNGGELIIEVLGMHLSDLAAPKRTVVN